MSRGPSTRSAGLEICLDILDHARFSSYASGLSGFAIEFDMLFRVSDTQQFAWTHGRCDLNGKKTSGRLLESRRRLTEYRHIRRTQIAECSTSSLRINILATGRVAISGGIALYGLRVALEYVAKCVFRNLKNCRDSESGKIRAANTPG
jgi:hypothetical protein